MAGHRRKRGGRVTAKCGPGGGIAQGKLSAAERLGLEDIFAKFLRSAGRDLTDEATPLEPLEVEMWASQLWSIIDRQYLADMDPVAVFAGGLISYAAARRTREALMVLRALAAVAPEPYRSKARRAADRVAEGGVVEPSWAALVGTASASAAWLAFDPIDDDGVSVMVSFHGPAGGHTLGLYVDHNLGGIAKDGFVVPAAIQQVLEGLRKGDETEAVEYREIPVAEAAARWRDAFDMTDMTVDPPVTEDLSRMRALLAARLSELPVDATVPAPPEMNDDDRERILDQFLVSDEASRLLAGAGGKHHDVAYLAAQAMTFSLDCVGGTPLRFSPVMAEIFCLGWAPRKIAAPEDVFAVLPVVLAAWIRFVGRRRAIPAASSDEAVQAAHGYAAEMIELSRDPANWGPAKTIALAVRDRGIDITDQAALDEFMAGVNRAGGIDALAESLVTPR